MKFFRNKRPFKLTRGGWIFILYTIGVGAGAINTGNNLLYLIFGIFLGLIMASGVLSDANLWNVDCEMELPHKIEASQRSFFLVKLINKKKWMPAMSVTIQIEGDLRGKPIELFGFFPSVPKSGSAHQEIFFSPAHRGFFEIKKIRLRTKFPFGLLRKQWTISSAESAGIYVFPKLLELSHQEFLTALHQGDESPRQDQHGDGVSIRSIRPFRQDDNPRYIHWKATAKRNSTIVREMEGDEKLELVLTWPPLGNFPRVAVLEAEKLIQTSASVISKALSLGHTCRIDLGQPTDNNYAVVKNNFFEFLSVFEPENPSGPRVKGMIHAG